MYNINNLFVAFGDRVLFDDITFSIAKGDKIGLAGRNGAGKSTLLKLIAKRQKPDGGSVDYQNEAKIGFLSQDLEKLGDKPLVEETKTALTEIMAIKKKIDDYTHQLEHRTDYTSDAYMNIVDQLSDATTTFDHLGGYSIDAKVQYILTGLGFSDTDMKKSVDKFSGGWKMRISLAKILLQNPDLLLLDEPTNHLDLDSIIWLENFLSTSSSTVILISHDTQFLDNITNRTIEIENAKIYDYPVSYTKYRIMRKERRDILRAAYENQQKQISQKVRTIERFRAKASKAKMAKSMEKQLEKMEFIELDDVNHKELNIKFQPAPRSGREVIKIDKLSKSFGSNTVIDKVSLDVERGDKIAFVGQNGQGKTTLAKMIVSDLNLDAGSIQLGYNVNLGYYAQDQSKELNSQKSVLQTIEDAAPDEWRPRVRSLLGAFLFSGDDVNKKVSVLSGGERARLALASLLMHPYNLLILDEPTNHLDIYAKEVLKNAIQVYDGTLIVVSHDREFLDDLTTKIVEFRDGHLHTHIGGIREFLEVRKTQDMRDIEKKTKPIFASESKPIVADNKEKKKLEVDMSKVEKEISRLEEKISRIEVTMAQENFYQKPESQKTIEEHQSIRNELFKRQSQWETIFEQLESLT